VSTYPVLESPWIFHDLAPQCVHLASLASTTVLLLVAAALDGSILSHLSFERHVPSGSASLSLSGRL